MFFYLENINSILTGCQTSADPLDIYLSPYYTEVCGGSSSWGAPPRLNLRLGGSVRHIGVDRPHESSTTSRAPRSVGVVFGEEMKNSSRSRVGVSYSAVIYNAACGWRGKLESHHQLSKRNSCIHVYCKKKRRGQEARLKVCRPWDWCKPSTLQECLGLLPGTGQ